VPSILIRGLEPKTIDCLKARAKRNGRSLQSEVKLVVEQATGLGSQPMTDMLDRWNRRFSGRKFSSSVPLIREDRGR